MPSIRTFFRGLIGRIKEHMDTFFLAMGGILVPLGFSFIVAGLSIPTFLQRGFLAGGLAIVGGLIFWVGAYREVQKKEAQKKTDLKETHKLLRAIHQELINLGQNKE